MDTPLPNSFRQGPDSAGRFGPFGGRYVAETLMPLILEVERAYTDARRDPAFDAEWRRLLTHYVGRPSPLWLAERLTAHLGGAKVYLKRDELNHTGAHKIWPSTASPPPPPARCSTCPAPCSWARPTWSGSSPTCSA